MGKPNERGAGRKKALTDPEIAVLRERRRQGETISALAAECGISRQTLSGYLNPKPDMERVYATYRKWVELNRRFRDINIREYTMRMDFMWQDEVCTTILVDFTRRRIAAINETDDIIHRAFGIKAKPTWADFEKFLESRCFPRTRDHLRLVLADLGLDFYDPLCIIEKTGGRMAEDMQWIKITYLLPEGGV